MAAAANRGAPAVKQWAPLALLLLALSSVFVFGNDRSQFYRPGHHGFIAAQTMTVAANLSPEHGFAGFLRREPDADGGTRYVVYNRFPIGSYALIRLATLPAGDDIPGQILAARTLMLAFFAAAAVLAYLSLVRLLGDRRIALAATLLAFSPYYLLYYSDSIAAEESTNLFGVVLAFHGMTVFAQEGRFRQLLAKTAAALLLGWHAVALIVAFVLLALGRELVAARADGGGDRPWDDRRLRPRAILAYGAFSALCAALVLGFNLAAEYRLLGGEAAPPDLPTVQSLLRRSGIDAAQAHVGELGWPTFLRGQFGGAGGMTIPFALAERLGANPAAPLTGSWPPEASAPWFAALGAGASAVCLAGLRFLPWRALFAALLLTGWCWAVVFRGATSLHEFYAMFHLGVPLVFWSLALLGLRRVLGPRRAARALPAAALAAAALFALSAWDMSGAGHDAEAAQRQREIAADFEAIRAIASGRSVLVSPHAVERVFLNFYLAGSYIQIDEIGSGDEWRSAVSAAPDFVLAPVGAGGSLTPGNRRFHLYRPSASGAAWDAIAAREPALRAAFGIHLDGRTLTWVREDCAAVEERPRFFVRAVPLDARGRPAERFEFWFRERGLRLGGRCIARFGLPDYPLAGIRTGQLAGGDLPPVWQASLPAGDPSFPRGTASWYEDVTAAEPAVRGPFAVYRDGRTLTFVRDGCSREDAGHPFFVHAWAAGPGDLPEDSREAGFETLGFAFDDRGVRFGGTCMARIELPDYALRGVRTGQRRDGLPPVWEASLPVADPSFPRGVSVWYERVTAAEPAARGPFAVYRDGRALTYVREDCAAADTVAPFFAHAWAADPGDLPEDRRAAGFEALGIQFAYHGVRFGGTCMTRIELPDYALRSVRTGQYDDGGHLWDAEFAPGAEAWLARFGALDAREPDARSGGFALRLEGRTLSLAREGCSAADVADRFFVHAYAPDGSREAIDFWFRERGERHGDRCLASVQLPDYPLARIAAGQYDASGHLWEAALPIGE